MAELPTIRPTQNQEWDDAWDLVCRLGATRGRLANGRSAEDLTDHRDGVASQVSSAPGLPPISASRELAIDPDELARAIADIERASAALRQADPALESELERPAPPVRIASVQSVKVMIGVLWVSTILVTLGVIVTIASLS